MRYHWVSIVLGWFLVAGCGNEVIRYVDPPVILPEGGGYSPEGNPTLELGFYLEQLYAPLNSGDDCPVVHGLQGGTWTMPAIRVVGVDPYAVLSCSLTTDDGEVLGDIVGEVDFVIANDGWLEVQSYPIPVNHAAPNEEDPIDDLYGQGATLHCLVEDDEERSAETSVAVTLQEG